MLAAADGQAVLSYSEAQRRAYAWAGKPEATAVPTVAEAVADYVAYLKTEKKTGDGAEQAAELHIPPPGTF